MMVRVKREFREPTRAERLASADRALRKRARKLGERPVKGPTLACVMPTALLTQAADAARERRTARTVALATEAADRVIDTTAVILVPRTT